MSKILLLGDSSVAYMPTEIIGDENDEVINAGIININIDEYQKNICETISLENFEIIVLQIGLNNILNLDYNNDNREQFNKIVKNMTDFINDINRENIHFIIQSVNPTRNIEINKKIKIFNEKIGEHCYCMELDFLDVYDLLIDEEGLFLEKYTDDGIHPNINGYNLIANQINEVFLMYDINYFK